MIFRGFRATLLFTFFLFIYTCSGYESSPVITKMRHRIKSAYSKKNKDFYNEDFKAVMNFFIKATQKQQQQLLITRRSPYETAVMGQDQIEWFRDQVKESEKQHKERLQS